MCRERLLAHVQQHALLRIHEHRLCRLDAEQSLVEQMRVTQVGAEAWDDLRVAKAVMQCVGVPAYCRHYLKALCCQRKHCSLPRAHHPRCAHTPQRRLLLLGASRHCAQPCSGMPPAAATQLRPLSHTPGEAVCELQGTWAATTQLNRVTQCPLCYHRCPSRVGGPYRRAAPVSSQANVRGPGDMYSTGRPPDSLTEHESVRSCCSVPTVSRGHQSSIAL